MTEQKWAINQETGALTVPSAPVLRVLKVTSQAWDVYRAYDTDAGFDLASTMQYTIQPSQFLDVRTDLAVAMPNDCWGLVVGRSSLFRKHKLIAMQGIIDPGYRGELFVGVYNPTLSPIMVAPGQRIGQLIPMMSAAIGWKIEYVTELPQSERGTDGFGSTGGHGAAD
jgi:dUTP pyrophosphatase